MAGERDHSHHRKSKRSKSPHRHKRSRSPSRHSGKRKSRSPSHKREKPHKSSRTEKSKHAKSPSRHSISPTRHNEVEHGYAQQFLEEQQQIISQTIEEEQAPLCGKDTCINSNPNHDINSCDVLQINAPVSSEKEFESDPNDENNNDKQTSAKAHTMSDTNSSEASALHDDMPDQVIQQPHIQSLDKELQDILMSGIDNQIYGPPLSENMLGIAKVWFGKSLDEKIKDELKERHLPPNNTHLLTSKIINAEIYKNLNTNQKKIDAKIKSIETLVNASAEATFRVLDSVIANKGDKDSISNLADIGKLQALQKNELILLRKNMLRPALSSKYATLANTINFDSTELFGSDLGSDVKKLEETSKVTQQVAAYSRGAKTRGFQRGKPQRGGAFRFQGQYQSQSSFQPQQQRFQNPNWRPNLNWRGRGRGKKQ